MAKFTTTLAADSTGKYVCDVKKSREYRNWFATVGAQGTWGSGTLTWFFSIDQGVTLIPIKDVTDTAISQTANGGVNIELGSGNTNKDNPQIWVKLSGSTSPSLLIFVLDNRS